MKNFYPCPICGSKTNFESYFENIGTIEKYIHCPVCNYRFQFCYGAYFEEIGNKYFIYFWYDNIFNNPRLFKKINKAMFIARKRWKKHKKKTCAKNCPL